MGTKEQTCPYSDRYNAIHAMKSLDSQKQLQGF